MNRHIEMLDAALAENGEDIILRRTVGTVNAVNIDAKIRANVRVVVPRNQAVDLPGGVAQDHVRVITSPTEIKNAQWPGGGIDAQAPFNIDRSLPKRSDRVIIKGRVYHVDTSSPIAVGGEVVRIEILAKGGGSGG